MPTNQYLAFGIGGGANVISPSAYQALATTVIANGFQPGIALSEQVNAVLKQTTVGVAGLAKFAVDWGTLNMMDDGSVINFAAGIKSAIDRIIAAATTLPGAVVAYAMTSPPTGWLECDGSAVNRGSYAALFAAIGTTYGAGDGSSTFNLPDLRGEFVRGWDHGRGVDSGRTIGTTQADMLKAHNHLNGVAEDTGHGQAYVYGFTSTDMPGSATGDMSDGGNTPTIQGYTSNTGGAETRPVNVSMMYCIKF